MLIPAIIATTVLVFLAEPVQQQDGGHEECLFAGDCLRHAFGDIHASFGKCASRSAWREQFVHTTPDERGKMWKTRHQTMTQRIMRSYRLEKPQEKIVQEVFDDFYAANREAMGETLSERINLGRQFRARHREYGEELLRKIRGEEPTQSELPPWQDDPVLLSIKDRMRQIDHDYPIVWNVVLDRIDKVLPKEQAKRGRERLAEQYPHGFSGEESRKKSSTKQENGGSEAALDRWRAYFKKFVERYELTGGQANAAKSILDEFRERAARMNHLMQDEIARYQANDNAKSAKLVAEAFQFDLDDLFDEFMARLDAILTTSQRDM